MKKKVWNPQRGTAKEALVQSYLENHVNWGKRKKKREKKP